MDSEVRADDGEPVNKPPSPIDRDAIAKAREAIRRGEKGLTKDQMIWRDKHPPDEAAP